MSEKRFTTDYSDFLQNDKTFIKRGNERLTYKEIVDLLNEQQATITHLEKVNGKNFAKRRLLEQDNLVLRNENEQLRKELNDCEKFRYSVFKRMNEEYIKECSIR